MSRGGDLGMMIMMLCGFAAYMTHIGANDMVVKLASKPLQYINSLPADDCRLFCRLSDVSGRLFRNRSGCFADGNPISGDGKRWYQSAQLLPFVPPRRRLFSHRLQGMWCWRRKLPKCR